VIERTPEERNQMKRIFRRIALALALLVALTATFAAWNLWGRPISLRVLADRQAIDFVRHDPEILTSLGFIDGSFLDRHSGQLTEVSVAERDAAYARAERHLSEVKGYAEPSTYQGQDRWTALVLEDLYNISLDWKRFDWATAAGPVYAVDQLNGAQMSTPTFLQNQHPVRNAKTARNYVKRLEALDEKLDQLGIEVKRQADLHVVLPSFLFDKVLNGMKDLTAPEPEKNTLYTGFVSKLAEVGDLSETDKKALAKTALAAISEQVYPGYRRLADTLNEVRPKASAEAGVWRLPLGDLFYASAVKRATTTSLTPDEIHQLGLSEVARIEVQMTAILDAEGAEGATLAGRIDALSKRADQTFTDDDNGREAILQSYRDILKDIQARVPAVFSATPKASLEVQRVPAYSEGGAAGAYYEQPAFDGSRPGVFFANLKDVSATPKFGMKTLAAHEGVPGHHFQIARAMELEGLPLVRKVSPYTAYVEGWALYAEALAVEMGVYQNDRLGDLGRLQAEMFRAVRLVVDTGIHSKKWTREQAITYMREKTGMAESEVDSEIDRYIVFPGQALAYKVGMLKLLELRERSKKELGAKFDLKAFHEVVLSNGALPLTVLDRVVAEWVKSKS
jgi:uncharacterized protein (DUF885 family)